MLGGINLSSKKRIKVFYLNGKPILLIKLFLPEAKCENESFVLRFNSFYDSLISAYFKEGESFSKRLENLTRPVSFNVECKEKTAPAGKIFIIRSCVLRFPDGKSFKGESLDIFDLESGILLKPKRKQIFTKKKKLTEK